MFKIVFTRRAFKVLLRMPKKIAGQIREELDRLASDPYGKHNKVTKLQNRPGYRLRVGDWRVIYELKSENPVILVLKIGPRGGIYQ